MLRWRGTQWLELVPARDLTAEDLAGLAELWGSAPAEVEAQLLASGCYEAVKE